MCDHRPQQWHCCCLKRQVSLTAQMPAVHHHDIPFTTAVVPFLADLPLLVAVNLAGRAERTRCKSSDGWLFEGAQAIAYDGWVLSAHHFPGAALDVGPGNAEQVGHLTRPVFGRGGCWYLGAPAHNNNERDCTRNLLPILLKAISLLRILTCPWSGRSHPHHMCTSPCRCGNLDYTGTLGCFPASARGPRSWWRRPGDRTCGRLLRGSCCRRRWSMLCWTTLLLLAVLSLDGGNVFCIFLLNSNRRTSRLTKYTIN